MSLSDEQKKAAHQIKFEENKDVWLTNVDETRIVRANGGYVMVQNFNDPDTPNVYEGVLGKPNPTVLGDFGIFEMAPK